MGGYSSALNLASAVARICMVKCCSTLLCRTLAVAQRLITKPGGTAILTIIIDCRRT